MTWDTYNGEMIRIPKGHTGQVRSLQLLTENRLASGSSDQTIRIWSTTNGVINSLKSHKYLNRTIFLSKALFQN